LADTKLHLITERAYEAYKKAQSEASGGRTT